MGTHNNHASPVALGQCFPHALACMYDTMNYNPCMFTWLRRDVITNIRIQNFKSIDTGEAGFALRPLNVLIGKNGSGKSNFLKFFELLRAGANGRLRDTINAMAGFLEIRYYDADDNDSIKFELTLTDVYNKEPLCYSANLAPQGRGTYVVSQEEIEREPSPIHTKRFKFLSAAEGRVRILKSVGDKEDETDLEEFDNFELVAAQLRDRTRYPALNAVRRHIINWQSFRGFDAEALQKIVTPQLLNPIDADFRLSESGDGIISILHALANQSEYAELYEDLITTLHTVFPDLEKFDVRIVAGGMGTLTYRSRNFPKKLSIPLSSMSDGQLRFLGLALLLLLPSNATLDEPEIGLHPSMLHVLAEMLKIAAERTQIIVSTHSPDLIARLQPEDVITVEKVITDEKEKGRSRLNRLDKDALESWLQRYTLGQLWTMGRLTHA